MLRSPRSPRALLAALAALLPAAAARAQVVLPPEGATLNRLHVQFRWAPFPTERYRLQVVVDDGSPDPFAAGVPVAELVVPADAPRALVTSGLSFAQDYAWRVLGDLEDAAPGSKARPVRRFATAALSAEIPDLELVVPVGAPPPEPGIALWSMYRLGSLNGYVLGADEDGQLVFALELPDEIVQDVRLLPDGRLLMNTIQAGAPSGKCLRAWVMTLDGRRVWASPDAPCQAPPTPPFQREGVHHEVFPMPETAPHGANFMMLEYDNRIIPYGGDPTMWWQGDRVVEYDRHTLEVVWEWSVFDDVSLDDHLPPDHPDFPGPGGDWTHGNAVIYVDWQDSVYVSLRRQSRVLRIDYATGNVIYQLGESSFPSGDVPPDFGDNKFSAQHSPQVLPNGNLLIYDNGNYTEPLTDPRRSRAVELLVDHLAVPPRAFVTWAFRQVEEDLVTEAYAPFAGDADRLAGGHTISNDPGGANLMECDAAGDVVWFLDAGPEWPVDAMGNPGANIYRVDKAPALLVDTPGDADGDWDLDLHDLAALQNAFTGPGNGPLSFPASLSDQDADDDVDADDAARFAYYLSGPGR